MASCRNTDLIGIGSAGDRRPYADQVRFWEVELMGTPKFGDIVSGVLHAWDRQGLAARELDESNWQLQTESYLAAARHASGPF